MAREFNKRIEIWQTVATDDGFGGQTIGDNIITTTWAKLETVGSTSTVALGLDFTQSNILVSVRKRKDLEYSSKTLYIKYRGAKYTINTFPLNENFVDNVITFIMVKEKPQSSNIYIEI